MRRRGGEKALKRGRAAGREGEPDEIERIRKPIDGTDDRLPDHSPRRATFRFDQVSLPTSQGKQIARLSRRMAGWKISQPVRLARQELIRVLNELNRRESLVPGPHAFNGQSGEDSVTDCRLRLRFQIDRIPARLKRDRLSHPLPKGDARAAAKSEQRQPYFDLPFHSKEEFASHCSTNNR